MRTRDIHQMQNVGNVRDFRSVVIHHQQSWTFWSSLDDKGVRPFSGMCLVCYHHQSEGILSWKPRHLCSHAQWTAWSWWGMWDLVSLITSSMLYSWTQGKLRFHHLWISIFFHNVGYQPQPLIPSNFECGNSGSKSNHFACGLFSRIQWYIHTHFHPDCLAWFRQAQTFQF